MENNNTFINNNIPPIGNDQLGGINDENNKAFIGKRVRKNFLNKGGNNSFQNLNIQQQQQTNDGFGNFNRQQNTITQSQPSQGVNNSFQNPNIKQFQQSNDQFGNFNGQQNTINQQEIQGFNNSFQNSNIQQQQTNDGFGNFNRQQNTITQSQPSQGVNNSFQNPNIKQFQQGNNLLNGKRDNKFNNRINNRIKSRIPNNEILNKNLTIEELQNQNPEGANNSFQNPNIKQFQQSNDQFGNFNGQQNTINQQEIQGFNNSFQNPNIKQFQQKKAYIPPYDDITKNIINTIFLLFSGILIFDLYQIIVLNNGYFYSIFSHSLLNNYSYIPTNSVKSIITIILTILVFSLLIFFPFILNNKLKNIIFKNTENIVLLFKDSYKKNFENMDENKEYGIKILFYLIINLIIIGIYHYILKYLFIKPGLDPIKVIIDGVIVIGGINFYTNILYYFSSKTLSKNITETRKNINYTIIFLLLYSIGTMLFLELLFYLSTYLYNIVYGWKYIGYFL